ncbi:FAD-dependent oxidoreductase [Sandaracinobacteroides saxicola]|uniref:FAD-dependent oxidoreductase n=1 Tax=Sandaracinobacteroides saxicola TaxID=2759707 RepID=A0A7G5IHN1_9SPHN|nr:FAD-dependent oxidoreductase [Sandaracinobacteroides saxicola]QMW22873.1 FAD-dependent oxidoreductase [Sandaracinobacteroides saxicola]
MDDIHYPVVIIGAGAAGLTAALAARGAGADVLVIERDGSPRGTTAMSTGLIPAAGTPEQAAAGIADSPARFAADIIAKTKGSTDPVMAAHLAAESAATIAFLQSHAVPLSLVDGFLYPGHSARRMMGTPNRTGEELMAALAAAASRAGVDLLTDARADALDADADGLVRRVTVERPDGARETIACTTLILACCGFAGNRDLVARHIPEMLEATFHGHPGNTGDALRWGEALGAALADMDAYQGHGGLAWGHGIPILWPLIMEGGFQVNRRGERFSNESLGYSEQAVKVVAQPEKSAWSVFDARCDTVMRQFDDYRDALSAGAIIQADSLAELAARCGLPAEALERTAAQVEACVNGAATCPFGRDFTGKTPLQAPWFAARVTGALFHTQGGLVVDPDARVLRGGGGALPNLFAAGGAARGISGRGAGGYLAGNGLLTATTLGRLAGTAAARRATV